MPRTSLVLLLALIVSVVFVPGVVDASPGSPDRGFGTGGHAYAGFGVAPSSSEGASLLELDDGSTVTRSTAWDRTVLSRFDSNGNLDRSFGNDGFVLVPNNDGKREFVVYDYRVDSQKRVSFYGSDDDFNGQLVFGRLTAEGDIDRSFGSNGFHWSLRISEPRAGTFDSSGRLLLVEPGFRGKPDLLRRFTPNGRPDPSFGDNGVVRYFPRSDSGGIDRIYTAGNDVFLSGEDRIVKLKPNGEFDTTFGQEGEVRGQRYYISVDSSGRLIVIRDGLLTRLLPNGDVDISFGPNGNGRVATGGEVEGYISLDDGSTVIKMRDPMLNKYGLLKLDPDGRYDTSFGDNAFMAVSGSGDLSLYPGPDKGLRVLDSQLRQTIYHRFDATGQPVSSFGEDGQMPIPLVAPTDDWLSDTGRRQDGSLLLAGNSGAGILLRSFTPRGKIDPRFGKDGGILLAPLDSKPSASIPKLAIDNKGNGYVCAKANRTPTLWKVTPKGILDKGFGDDGAVKLPGRGRCKDITFDGVGPVIAYNDSERTYDIVILRYRPDGKIDSSYGRGGKATIPTKYGISGSYRMTLVTDRQGRTVAMSNSDGLSLIRLRQNGKPDHSFGKKGLAVYGANPRKGSGKIKLGLISNWSLAMDGTGRILIGGSTKNGPAVARINGDGRPDRQFGRQAVSVLPTPTVKRRDRDRVLGLTRQSDGRIVAVGRYRSPCYGNYEICPRPMFTQRLTDRGKFDRGFSSRAMKSVWTPGNAQGQAVFADKTGVTVAGTVETSSQRQEFALFRVKR